MKLIPNWRRIARKAWSVRLMALASVLTGCEAILPLVGDSVPRGSFAVLSFFIVTGALLTRFLAQKELHDDQ
jgi:hypothetical protein